MARSLFKTLDNISTPCSLNANGKYDLLFFSFEIAIAISKSPLLDVSWNMKSSKPTCIPFHLFIESALFQHDKRPARSKSSIAFMISDYIDFAFTKLNSSGIGVLLAMVISGCSKVVTWKAEITASSLINLINSSISKCYFKGIPDRADPDGYRDCPVRR